jgi:hypothetical protein
MLYLFVKKYWGRISPDPNIYYTTTKKQIRSFPLRPAKAGGEDRICFLLINARKIYARKNCVI